MFRRSIAVGVKQMTRQGDFIDPGGQPYWIAYESRKDGTWNIVVYSFGPDRRRDLQTRDLELHYGESEVVLGGDDPGVYILGQRKSDGT